MTRAALGLAGLLLLLAAAGCSRDAGPDNSATRARLAELEQKVAQLTTNLGQAREESQRLRGREQELTYALTQRDTEISSLKAHLAQLEGEKGNLPEPTRKTVDKK